MGRAMIFARKYGIAVITVLLFVVLALTTDGFATDRNFRNLLDQQSTVLIAASFMTIAIIAGNFDVSVSAVFVTAPLFALTVENATGSVALALVVALIVGLAMGLFNGIVVTRFKVNSFIGTLGHQLHVLWRGLSDFRPVPDAAGGRALSANLAHAPAWA